jgi:UDP-N-acetylglucosamine diphosphorylase/glucosamine-1-phosphate N-acetyltransferase
VEEGAKVAFATLNAATGPVYIGKNAEIMEGALIRGPFALCEESQVKMGARIYGPTTIGPGSKAGGEINNSILFAHSNKVHDGYLGNSVLGEWCNLGADTNASNLKNSYEPVRVWDYASQSFQHTGLQFCGLIMGDYSKCGINTMFNTATVVGICANIFGAGFPRSFVPSFSKGGPAGFRAAGLEEVFQSIERQMSRRGLVLTGEDRHIITHVSEHLDRCTVR